MNDREYNDEYKKFLLQVRVRDKRRCQYPGCKKKYNHVHHIIPWSDSVELRYEVTNGICLCKTCHKKVTGHEYFFVDLFRTIVNNKKKKK